MISQACSSPRRLESKARPRNQAGVDTRRRGTPLAAAREDKIRIHSLRKQRAKSGRRTAQIKALALFPVVPKVSSKISCQRTRAAKLIRTIPVADLPKDLEPQERKERTSSSSLLPLATRRSEVRPSHKARKIRWRAKPPARRPQ